MATSEPPTVTLLRGNQPTETADLPGVKWFNTGIVLTSFSAWDNGGGNPWLAIMIFVLLLFLFIASTIRFCYAIQEGNPPTEITCCGLIPCCGYEPRNVNGCSQVLAWIAWTLFIGSLIIHHLTFQHEWRGGIIRGKYAWAWILLSVTTFAVLVFEVLNLFWYGAPCIGGRSCCERQLGESKSQKQERNPHALAEKSGDDALLFPTRIRPCCPLLVDCCNDEHDQHSRAWRCRIGGCCRRVNHAENPSWFLTHAPPALRDCLCVQTPMEPVRKRGVGQGISYHADSVDQLEALKHDGNECFRAEKYEGAIAAYTAAIEIAPESALAPLFCSRSAAYNKGTKKDDHEQAVEDAQEAIDLGPGTKLLAKAHLRLGEANEELQRYRLARAAFERALELEPENKLHRTALYRVLAEDEQLHGNKKNVLDMIAQYHGGGKDNEEGIPEITMTHADFATLDDLTADLPRDDTFTQTSVKLMLSQTPGVEGGGRSHRGGGGHAPGGTREKRRMKAEKLVQHAERGARNLSEHQHRQRGGVEEIDLEEQKEYAESNCKEYIEHVEQEARERMADAISRDWSQRVDVEMQSRILAEEKAKRLQSELDETSRLVGDTQATNRPVFVVSSLQTKPLPPVDLPNVTVENLQQEFNDLWRWPEDIFKQVRLLRAAKQWETEKEKDARCKYSPVGGSQRNSEMWQERLPFWILEFEAELHPNESVAANMQRAWEVLRMPESRRKFEDQNMLTTDPQHRTVELEIEDDELKIAAFEREDRYQQVKADLNKPVQDPAARELPTGKKKLLVFTVRPYYWSCLGGSIGTVPTKAIAGQPQPVKHGLDPKVWTGNTDAELGPVGVWKECSVGPSEAVKETRDSHGNIVKRVDTQTTETHRRAAHLVRDTQGGYADLVCISAIVMSFLQGASDFVVSMAPLLILYEVFGDGTDGTEGGGLDWEYACPPARIGLEYDEFSVASAFQDTLSEALSGARRQRRSLLVLETCDESDRICMLQSNLSVSGWWCLLGALFLGVGAILLGHRTLNRLSFELVTSCAPADGFCATTAATLVWAVFLLAGVPLSLTYLTIGAMMGMASGIGVKGPKIHCFSPSDIDKKWAAIGAFVGTGVGLLVGALVSKPGVGIGIGVGVTAFIAVAEAAYHERVKWNRFLVELVVGFLCAGLLTGFLSALLFTFSTAMVPTTEFEPLTWPTLGVC
jgi:tetratricopeptide (TPR) repeat protein